MADKVAIGFLSLVILLFPSLISAESNCSGPCKTFNDCSGELICIQGKCNDDPDLGTNVCSSSGSGGGGGGGTQSSSSHCRGPCKTLNDCYGELICIKGQCNDDPETGNHACALVAGRTPAGGEDCGPSGYLLNCPGRSYPTYDCSPPITGTAATRARLTNNDFSAGASPCDQGYHNRTVDTERIVALSTGWFGDGKLCGENVTITAVNNGRTTTAIVMDECDSWNGCDQDRGYRGPCAHNIVHASNAVWKDLKLDIDAGVVNVLWSMTN